MAGDTRSFCMTRRVIRLRKKARSPRELPMEHAMRAIQSRKQRTLFLCRTRRDKHEVNNGRRVAGPTTGDSDGTPRCLPTSFPNLTKQALTVASELSTQTI